MTKGKCVVLSAPSGSGKTTLAKRLLQNTSLQLAFSISATSRKPRANEKDGVDYFFIKPQSFKEQIDKESFLEYEEVYPGIFYGTLRAEVERLWNEGKHVVFDVDVVGGLNLKKEYGEKAVAIFVKVPDFETLEKRLRGRGTENEESLKKRLEKVKWELTFQDKFDHKVLNDELENAVAQSKKIIDL